MMYFNQVMKGLVAAATISLLATGCASTRETTTTTEVDDPNAPMESTTVVSSNANANLDDLKFEFEMFNKDEIDPETKTVIVKDNYPVAAIFFDFDVAKLDEANMIGVERANTWLLSNPNKGLVIIGHADKQGSMPYNQQLALERAQAAGNALVEKGIDSSRIVIVTHGEEHLKYVLPEYNRRVVFMTDPANAYGVNEAQPSSEKTVRVVAMKPRSM
jgi:outer membrane protein OmpA-like peptidoglycan-associated protein